MKGKISTTTLCYCCGTTALMEIAMLLVGGGLTSIATSKAFTINSCVIFVLETRRFSHMNMSSSPYRNCANMKSSAMITQARSIKAASRAIRSVDFVGCDSMAMMSYTPIAETSMRDVTSVIEGVKVASSNTLQITITSSYIFGGIIFFVLKTSAWRKSLLYSSQRWI